MVVIRCLCLPCSTYPFHISLCEHNILFFSMQQTCRRKCMYETILYIEFIYIILCQMHVLFSLLLGELVGVAGECVDHCGVDLDVGTLAPVAHTLRVGSTLEFLNGS